MFMNGVIKKNQHEKYSWLFLLCSALAVSNLFLYGSYILLIMSVFFFVFEQKIVVCGKSVILTLFALTYFVFRVLSENSASSAIKPFIFVACWEMSYMLSKKKSMAQIFLLITVLALGMAAHGVMNFIYNSISGTKMIEGKSFDFWSQSISASTGQAINFTLFLSIFFWMLFLQSKTTLKIIGGVLLLISTLYDVQLGGRTFFILIGLSIVSSIVLLIALGAIKPRYLKRFFPIFLIFIFSAIVIYVMYVNDVFEIKTAVEKSYLFKRLNSKYSKGLQEDGRIAAKKAYWKLFFQYPFGGNRISAENNTFAHELWLDVYDDAGIIPYIFLCIYSISVLTTIAKIIRFCNIDVGVKVGLINYTVVLYAQFFVEPILSGAPLLFASFLMIDAALTQYYHSYTRSRKEPVFNQRAIYENSFCV